MFFPRKSHGENKYARLMSQYDNMYDENFFWKNTSGKQIQTWYGDPQLCLMSYSFEKGNW